MKYRSDQKVINPFEVTDPNGQYDYKIVTISDPPFVIIEKDEFNQTSYKGFLLDLLKLLAQDLKFTYHLYQVPDQAYGSFDSVTGQWSGIVGELTSKKADFALSAMTITPLREQYIDFTHRYYDYSVSLAMKNTKVDVDRFAILRPFSGEVWLSIIIAFFVIGILLYWVNSHRITRKHETGNSVQKANRVNDTSLMGTFWFVFSGTMQQSADMVLITMSSKVLTGVWWFFIVIVLSLYTATLLAFLTVEHLKKPINSFQELVNQNPAINFTYGTLKDTSFYDFLQEQKSAKPDSIEAQMFKMVSKNSVSSVEAGYKRVTDDSQKSWKDKWKTKSGMQDGYAFLFDTASVKYQIINDDECKITTMQATMFPKGYGLAVPPAVNESSPEAILRNQLNMKILEQC